MDTFAHEFNHCDRYLARGLLLVQYTLVAVNTSDSDQIVPFWFSVGGDYLEELHGDSLNLHNTVRLQETMLTIPSNYGADLDGTVTTAPACNNYLTSCTDPKRSQLSTAFHNYAKGAVRKWLALLKVTPGPAGYTSPQKVCATCRGFTFLFCFPYSMWPIC